MDIIGKSERKYINIRAHVDSVPDAAMEIIIAQFGASLKYLEATLFKNLLVLEKILRVATQLEVFKLNYYAGAAVSMKDACVAVRTFSKIIDLLEM
jgi:hypothetical protein